eukprot:76870-Rhodomonas_salina.1
MVDARVRRQHDAVPVLRVRPASDQAQRADREQGPLWLGPAWKWRRVLRRWRVRCDSWMTTLHARPRQAPSGSPRGQGRVHWT